MFFVTDVHCFQLEDEAITKSENAKITISSFIQILLIIARNVGMKLKFEVIESLICMMTYEGFENLGNHSFIFFQSRLTCLHTFYKGMRVV